MATDVTPFRIAIPDAQLEDLRRRLAATRWPDAEPVEDWSQGIPLAYTQEVCRYWEKQYDWRKREARLNEFPQFRTEIDGLGIHFIHVRSPRADSTSPTSVPRSTRPASIRPRAVSTARCGRS